MGSLKRQATARASYQGRLLRATGQGTTWAVPPQSNLPAIPARRRLGMGSMVIASEVRASVGIQERGIVHKDHYESRDQKKEKHKQKENP